MHLLNKYDIYIFDCDGVIFDSNQLKIEAMRYTLNLYFSEQECINKSIEYFKNNFGKSRFHHVDYFLENIFKVGDKKISEFKYLILRDFSEKCSSLYLIAKFTPNVLKFIRQCQGKRYVASGSEQKELREVFAQRGLGGYFDGVFGSPTSKSDIIKHILEQEQSKNAVLFGDAESDMLSARQHDIDFVFYAPYSNVKDKMIEECQVHQHLIIHDFLTIRFNNEK